MKTTGIIRRIDDLGRVVIPKEIRRNMHIQEGDPLEISTASDGIVLRKYIQPAEDKASVAQKWLEDNAHMLYGYSAKFSIEGRTTVCEVISNNHRLTGKATATTNDTFIPAIGMVIAYCRAVGWTIPKELIED